MQRTIDLPTGPQPGWELQEVRPDNETLKAVSESLVVLHSLRQSRNRWITSMFPKFSTKARGSKTAEVVPPPHTIKAHGKYDLHIGPHVFPSTAVYEIHYLPEVETQPAQGSASDNPTDAASQQTPPPVPSVPSLSHVTPALSAKVALASQSNPTLANLLQAVVNRTATDDQTKTLGLLIRSLEGVHELGPTNGSVATTPSAMRLGSPKPYDIVIEFHEKPSDRWILPRGDVVCERVGIEEGSFSRVGDALLTTSFTPIRSSAPNPPETEEQFPDTCVPEVISFRFSRVTHLLWDLFFDWAGGSTKIEESKVKLTELVKASAPRTYLSHQLPEGELLAEIQNAVAPSYTMKSIKPAGADSTRAKRKSVSRKATLVSNGLPDKPTPTKRRQSLKDKVVVPLPIACHACGQRDVPLMMGGRYCRTCIDAGRAIADIPQVAPNRSHSTPAYQAAVVMSTAPSPTIVSDVSTQAPSTNIVSSAISPVDSSPRTLPAAGP